MSNYTIEEIGVKYWGLFDSESETPNHPVVTCHDRDLLEQIKKDFIQSDKAEKKRKPKRSK